MDGRIVKAAAELQVGDMVRGPFGGPVRVGDALMATDDQGRAVVRMMAHGVGTFELPPFMAVVVDG